MNPKATEVIDAKDVTQNFSDTSSFNDIPIKDEAVLPQEDAASEKLLYKFFIDEIWNVVIDSYEDDWDGYGSKKISDQSIAKAKLFCYNLQIPELLSKPYVGVDVDGYVMLTWQQGQDILSVIVQPNDTIVFSLIVGIDRLNGVLKADPGTIPSIITDKLNAFYKKCLQKS